MSNSKNPTEYPLSPRRNLLTLLSSFFSLLVNMQFALKPRISLEIGRNHFIATALLEFAYKEKLMYLHYVFFNASSLNDVLIKTLLQASLNRNHRIRHSPPALSPTRHYYYGIPHQPSAQSVINSSYLRFFTRLQLYLPAARTVHLRLLAVLR